MPKLCGNIAVSRDRMLAVRKPDGAELAAVWALAGPKTGGLNETN